MFPPILKSEYFLARPRLQRWLEHMFRVLFSPISGALLAFSGFVLWMSSFTGQPAIGISYLGFLAALFVSATLAIWRFVNTNQFSYRIETSQIRWTIRDRGGNDAEFEIRQKILLTRDTAALHSYVGLDEFVDEFLPFERMTADYEGHRKRIRGYFRAHFSAGRRFELVLRGKRTLPRQQDSRIIDVPVDFPTSSPIRGTIQITGVASDEDVNAEVLTRYAGEVGPSPESEIAIDFDRASKASTIRFTLARPQYGAQYLMTWRIVHETVGGATGGPE